MIKIMSGDLTAQLIARSDRQVRLEARARVFSAGERVMAVFVVLEGNVRLLRHRADGETLALQRAGPGDLLAEASMFAERYHCDAVCDTEVSLARVPAESVEALLSGDPAWLRGLAARLAAEVQRARSRAEMLSLKRVDQKVRAWLALNGGELPERGNWARLAEELAVTPEALYREFAKRRT